MQYVRHADQVIQRALEVVASKMLGGGLGPDFFVEFLKVLSPSTKHRRNEQKSTQTLPHGDRTKRCSSV